MSKKPAGRPRRDPDHPAKKRSVSATDPQWERWKDHAQRAGVSVSSWIQTHLERAADRADELAEKLGGIERK